MASFYWYLYVIELSDLHYRYPNATQDALAGISLQLKAGDCVGLLGANGAGKTTLLSLISGLRQPSSGQLKGLNALAVAIVPQQLAFYPELKVAENLALFADLHRLRGTERQQRLSWLIEACALEPHLKRTASQLSGGEQRRLNFAIGVLQPAQLYLFDEATVGVDAHSRQLLLACVEQLSAQGHCVIYTSHYLDEVERVAKRILLLDQGRVRLEIEPAQLTEQSHSLLLSWPAQPPEAIKQQLDALQLDYQTLADGWQINAISAAQLASLTALIATLEQPPRLLRFGRPSLEQLYLHLCAGAL